MQPRGRRTAAYAQGFGEPRRTAALYLGTSRCARPLPRGVTGHVAHPSRSIHQDYGEPGRTAAYAQGFRLRMLRRDRMAWQAEVGDRRSEIRGEIQFVSSQARTARSIV